MLFTYLLLLLSGLQIGLFGYGGPEALLSFAEHEFVVRHEWLTAAQFADIVALSRVTPGPAALNAATMAGYAALYQNFGFWPAVGGSAIGTVAVASPSLGMAALVERLRRSGRWQYLAESVLAVLRPLVPGLVVAAALVLAGGDSFGTPSSTPWHFGISFFLFVATIVGTAFCRFHPLFMLLLCGTAGWLLL